MCARAVSAFMKRIEGVESVDVSLEKGVATVALAPGNHVTLDEVCDAIRKNGFTPKGADVTVAGTVVERNGQPALAVSGTDVVYLLAEGPESRGKLAELRKRMGKPVVVDGHVPESAGKPAAPPRLQLRDVR